MTREELSEAVKDFTKKELREQLKIARYNNNQQDVKILVTELNKRNLH